MKGGIQKNILTDFYHFLFEIYSYYMSEKTIL